MLTGQADPLKNQTVKTDITACMQFCLCLSYLKLAVSQEKHLSVGSVLVSEFETRVGQCLCNFVYGTMCVTV
jgi:hypothetical protein